MDKAKKRNQLYPLNTWKIFSKLFEAWKIVGKKIWVCGFSENCKNELKSRARDNVRGDLGHGFGYGGCTFQKNIAQKTEVYLLVYHPHTLIVVF